MKCIFFCGSGQTSYHISAKSKFQAIPKEVNPVYRQNLLAAQEGDVEPERETVDGARLCDDKRQWNLNVVKVGLERRLKVHRVFLRPRQANPNIKSVLYDTTPTAN